MAPVVFTKLLSKEPSLTVGLLLGLCKLVSEEQLLELVTQIAFENYRSRLNRIFDGESDELYTPLPVVERAGGDKWLRNKRPDHIQARVRRKVLRRGILRDNLAMNTFELVAPESKSTASPALADMALKEIERLDSELSQTFEGSFVRSAAFNRTLVSFQANRDRPVYRWYKFKEGFSASLIEYLITSHNIKKGG